MKPFDLTVNNHRYGNVTPVNVPGSHAVFVIQSTRPQRALSEAYIHEVRVALSKHLGSDPYSLVVGNDYDFKRLIAPGELTRLIMTGEMIQR